jgi:hypothetical protein
LKSITIDQIETFALKTKIKVYAEALPNNPKSVTIDCRIIFYFEKEE